MPNAAFGLAMRLASMICCATFSTSTTPIISTRLGVDRLFVDEAHNYKNLFLYTKMRNVAGLSTIDAQKSSDMFAKCR